mmetsp:Transcript_119498/g.372312  ORF Transcript_119498/g.372312 Transcript_119498/m.372312 type:complete len:210 (-) Transcript_119498:370-999(-)
MQADAGAAPAKMPTSPPEQGRSAGNAGYPPSHPSDARQCHPEGLDDRQGALEVEAEAVRAGLCVLADHVLGIAVWRELEVLGRGDGLPAPEVEDHALHLLIPDGQLAHEPSLVEPVGGQEAHVQAIAQARAHALPRVRYVHDLSPLAAPAAKLPGREVSVAALLRQPPLRPRRIARHGEGGSLGIVEARALPRVVEEEGDAPAVLGDLR